MRSSEAETGIKRKRKIQIKKKKKKKVISLRGRLSLSKSEALYPSETAFLDEEDLKPCTEKTPSSRIAEILKIRGILGNKEAERRIQLSRCKVDPLYTIFFYPDHPDTAVLDPRTGEKVSLIDFMLNECYRLLSETLGSTFTNFKLITQTFENLMKTDDVHAKQWLFLFILEKEPPVRDMVMELYSTERYTPHRLESFLKKLHEMTTSTVALPYTDAINDYNVKNMVIWFLRKSVEDYMIYEKDPLLDSFDRGY